MEPTRVGNVVVQPVYDGVAMLGTDTFLHSDWTNHGHLLHEDGRVHLPVGAFVIRTGDRLVMIDAGIGVASNDSFVGGELLHGLRDIGIEPDEIDTIIVTHLHFDHCGWLDSRGTNDLDGAAGTSDVTFPNATIHIGAADWAHFVDDEGGGAQRAARLRSVADHVALIEHDSTIAQGVSVRATPGHTPGHQSVVVSSGDERLIVLGDVLHCPAQLTESEWQFLYDVDADLASTTRELMLREAQDPHTTLLPSHFPGMQAPRLITAGGTRRWVMP